MYYFGRSRCVCCTNHHWPLSPLRGRLAAAYFFLLIAAGQLEVAYGRLRKPSLGGRSVTGVESSYDRSHVLAADNRWPLRGKWLLDLVGVSSPSDLEKEAQIFATDNFRAAAVVGFLAFATCGLCCCLAWLNLEDLDAPPPRPDGWPLTKSFIVPQGRFFMFKIPTLLHKGRQTQRFEILDQQEKPVCHAVVDEEGENLTKQSAQIRLETRNERRLLAMVRTDAQFATERDGPVVESARSAPASLGGGVKELCICKSDGSSFASISKDRFRKNYVVKCGKETILTCYGSFLHHKVSMLDANGRKVAVVCEDPVDPGFYKGHVAPQEDAGLVLCCLLAIDKMEQPTLEEEEQMFPESYRRSCPLGDHFASELMSSSTPAPESTE